VSCNGQYVLATASSGNGAPCRRRKNSYLGAQKSGANVCLLVVTTSAREGANDQL